MSEHAQTPFLVPIYVSANIFARRKVNNQEDINSNFRNINLHRHRFSSFSFCLCTLAGKRSQRKSRRRKKKINLCPLSTFSEKGKQMFGKIGSSSKKFQQQIGLYLHRRFYCELQQYFSHQFSSGGWRG